MLKWKYLFQDNRLSFLTENHEIALENSGFYLSDGAKSIPLEVDHHDESEKKIDLELKSEALTIKLKWEITSRGKALQLSGKIENTSETNQTLQRLIVLSTDKISIGDSKGKTSFFKNGYQSWTASMSLQSEDVDQKIIFKPGAIMQENMHNLPQDKAGYYTSEMFTVIGNLTDDTYLLAGQIKQFDQFFYIRAVKNKDTHLFEKLELELDFGGQIISAGQSIELDDIMLLCDTHPNAIQDNYFEKIKPQARLNSEQELPIGWCSWYYYFTDISEEKIQENLDVIANRQLDWDYVQIDDGFQTAVGDWLSLNNRFPHGLKPIVDKIVEKGFKAGLWLAPFIARGNSILYKEHKDWFIKDDKGKPALAGWNPNWGIGGNYYGLDTTHPEFQQYLRQFIRTAVKDWGFTYLKLDFVYGASLYGQTYDPTLTPAQRLKLGYKIVREEAGEDVFILGCGSPLSLSIGLVDGMRIGPDVAPYWFATYRYHLTRDQNALCTKFAIRSTLNRCAMHNRLWINDPDCLLIRDTDTKLSHSERLTLTNAILITGGMLLFSDRLVNIPEVTWDRIKEIEEHARICYHGKTWALDYMERPLPEIIYNSEGYLALFNFDDRDREIRVNLSQLRGLLKKSNRLKSLWDDVIIEIDKDYFTLDQLPAHGSKIFKIL